MRNERYILEPYFGKILSPFERFLRGTTAGGILLIGSTALTLILANSPWGSALHDFWEQSAHVGFGTWRIELTLHQWVNEGLMTLFFLLVGLELKREIMVGELRSVRDAALPIVAAIGGMIVPALIYRAFNPGFPEARGWGIPMATDIAFAIGILVLLAWRIPQSLIVFLTALAIADDLGAVLVIALFYSQGIDLVALQMAGGLLVMLVVFNQGGIRHPLPYTVLGLALWLALLHSGIHATIAGVLLAFAIPARPAFTPRGFAQRLVQLQKTLDAEMPGSSECLHPLSCPAMATVAENLEKAARAVQSPQQHMEHTLSPWVTFLVIPIFAFCNAALDFSAIQVEQALRQSVTVGVVAGLVVGKFVGISATSWLAVKVGIGRLPSGATWRHLLGVAWLAGIGFTMSLFIDQLAFDDPVLVEQAKLGILFGSLFSGLIGLLWLLWASRGGQDVTGTTAGENSKDLHSHSGL